ncbi:phosphatidylinositol-binding clathrin assembly protein unc-11-like isoform X3 [Convolutriloba macropyga]|uniref:phosphatidylinositol-binding clathrin assembly protein unc-11-like isoform X3 n=1 Tax=Convolutriloba macropyga TaxID=536237 RepID=UPI003F51DC3A
MSGQSVIDRMQAAKHSVLGSQIGKKVCKATTEEILAPKRKHLEDLLQYTHDPNVNVTDIIDLLLSRTHNQNWVVVYKSLITLHHLMCYGHEKVIQNMASRTMELNLASYYDRKDMQGAQMSPFIQRYSKYLSAKAGSYRAIAFDFCNAKRGREEGKLRNMEAHELLMALPTLSDQLEALLEFQKARKEAREQSFARPSDLTNGIIIASFMLLFKDSIRLFASYNEGIINLLEKFFDMTSKKQCEQALNSYKKFLQQMENVGKFLKVAEEYGIDKGDIPDLTSAPSSLLEALESHYQGLESDKKSGVAKVNKAASKPPGIPKQLSVNAEAFAAVSHKPQSNNPFFFEEANEAASGRMAGISEADKQKALEEEQTEMNKFSSQVKSFNPFAPDAADSVPASNSSTTNTTAPSKPSVMDPFDDLLGLSTDTSTTSAPATQTSPFGNPPNAASSDPFGGSSVQPTSANTFDPFAAFNATPQQQNVQNSNPFLQSGATATGSSNSSRAMNNSSAYYQYPTAPTNKNNTNYSYSYQYNYSGNNANNVPVRYHVNHIPQPSSPLRSLTASVAPPQSIGMQFRYLPGATPSMNPHSMFGGTVSGNMWANDDGGSNPAGAKNAQASSNNAFAPNYSIDLETELSSLDMTAGSAVGISPQPASSPFADIGKQDNVSKDENGKDKGGNPYQQPGYPSMNSNTQQAVNFEAAFGTTPTTYGTSNVFGDVLQPTPIGGQQPSPMFNNSGSPMMMGGPQQGSMNSMGMMAGTGNKPTGDTSGLGKDLDSALANLATNLSTKSPSHRPNTQPQQTAW